jgi:hypothetical protein
VSRLPAPAGGTANLGCAAAPAAARASDAPCRRWVRCAAGGLAPITVRMRFGQCQDSARSSRSVADCARTRHAASLGCKHRPVPPGVEHVRSDHSAPIDRSGRSDADSAASSGTLPVCGIDSFLRPRVFPARRKGPDAAQTEKYQKPAIASGLSDFYRTKPMRPVAVRADLPVTPNPPHAGVSQVLRLTNPPTRSVVLCPGFRLRQVLERCVENVKLIVNHHAANQ